MDGDKLVQSERWDGKEARYVRQVAGDVLTAVSLQLSSSVINGGDIKFLIWLLQTCTLGDVVCVRKYGRVWITNSDDE